jgi:hypothetical protein
VEIRWIEEDTDLKPELTVLLIEGGMIEEMSEQRCDFSQVASLACECLHEAIGSSTLSLAGVSGPRRQTGGSGVRSS